MYKKSKNPQIEELTKSHKERSYAVGRLDFVVREDGTKGCIWCGDPLKSKHHMTRYCNDPECTKAIYAWSNPQKEEGMFFLMQRQNWCCNICGYDYKPFIEQNILGKFYGTGPRSFKKGTYKTEFCFAVIKRMKENMDDPLRKPEVDHITPISKGGNSLGLENHQILCYHCHKNKTKRDLSGVRKKKDV